MSSPSPPKPQKINPYQGMNSDPRFYEAQQALGISNPNNADEINQINQYIFEQDLEGFKKDSDFTNAAAQLVAEGKVDASSYKYHDQKSYEAWAEKKGFNKKRSAAYSDRMAKEYGENWYGAGVEGIKYDRQNITSIQGRQEENKYSAQTAEQNQTLEDNYNRMRADQLEDAEAQRKMMEEMMNQPVYMPKQQQMPVVQKPQVQNDPILPAPAPNTPMSIAAPPAPELANTGSRMAIVRTPASTQARSRRATRGTSSLTN